jgi:hypothetical protein
MKLYLEPVDVETDGGKPRKIRWRRTVFTVEQILDGWIAQGKWWRREEKRIYLRLLTDRGIIEVFRIGERWKLSRLFD